MQGAENNNSYTEVLQNSLETQVLWTVTRIKKMANNIDQALLTKCNQVGFLGRKSE